MFLVGMSSCNNSEFSVVGECNQSNQADCSNQQVFTWFQSGFPKTCPTSCGTVDVTQTVECRDQDGTRVTDSQCSGIKPSASSTCTSSTDCTANTYRFDAQNFSDITCSKSCGAGVKTRTVRCLDSSNATVADTFCTGQNLTRPAATQACNLGACTAPDAFSWVIGAWSPSACPSECGTSVSQTRTIQCRSDRTGLTTLASNCSAAPTTTRACSSNACEYTYSWETGEPGACETVGSTCVAPRSLGCKRNDGVFVTHAYCDAGQKPSLTQACNASACPTTPDPNQCVNPQQLSYVAPQGKNSVDVLVVLDDSPSVSKDNIRFSQQLHLLVQQMNAAKLDWRMCITSTDVGYYDGAPVTWEGLGRKVLTKNDGNLSQIFVNTVARIGHGFSQDEQAIKSINRVMQRNSEFNCFRQYAAAAFVIVSDEDERSVGGRSSWSTEQYKQLTYLNTPQSVPNTLRSMFPDRNLASGGTYSKQMVTNAIIVNDSSCKSIQDAQGSKAFYGWTYKNLAYLNDPSVIHGHVGSICDTNFANSFQLISTQVSRCVSSIPLTCEPSRVQSLNISSGQQQQNAWTNEGSVFFHPVLGPGDRVEMNYCCGN